MKENSRLMFPLIKDGYILDVLEPEYENKTLKLLEEMQENIFMTAGEEIFLSTQKG
jgi:hypothetical protein